MDTSSDRPAPTTHEPVEAAETSPSARPGLVVDAEAHTHDHVLQAVDVGYWEWDLLAGQVAYSRCFAELIGAPGPGPRALVDAFRALDDAGLEAWLAACDSLCTGRTDRLSHVLQVPGQGDEVRLVRLRGRITGWSPTGEPRRVIGLALDITADHRRTQQAHAVRRLDAIGALAAGVAHEINTPLQFVSDNLDFLAAQCGALDAAALDETVPAALPGAAWKHEVAGAIADAIEGVARVTRIVRALKEFAHRGGDENDAVDVNHVVENAITLTRHEWKAAATIERDLAPGLPPVRAAAYECGQVLVNLLVNAAHAIVAARRVRPGRLTVSTRSGAGHIEIRVSDDGTGIPAALRARVFEPFFTTKGVGQGTGQGLAKCREIVERYGGTIHFETTPGQGTTFVVRLPADVSAERRTA